MVCSPDVMSVERSGWPHFEGIKNGKENLFDDRRARDSGKRRQGCLMGPDAFRVAGLGETLNELGFEVEDRGNVAMGPVEPASSKNKDVFALGETIAWTKSLFKAAKDAMAEGFPIFMGGDHSLSLGTVAGVASYAKEQARPLYVLWLDAHSDYHSPLTTASGNLHGTPVGYVCGRDGSKGSLNWMPKCRQSVCA